jgi:hypothetical protein
MGSVIGPLVKKKLAQPPAWLESNVHYETIMGSVAYGVSSDTSDYDVYGWCIPPKDMVFPPGEIPGFGRASNGVKPKFAQYQQHHMYDPEALAGKGRTYDVQIFSIVKYFDLLMGNNPNVIDSLFTPVNCVLHATRVGNLIREKRRLFLHKGSWHTFRGYAYSQLHKMDVKPNAGEYQRIWAFEEKYGIPRTTTLDDVQREIASRESGNPSPAPLCHFSDEKLAEYQGMFIDGFAKTKRFGGVKVHGADWKFGYHVVRLVMEAEQIMVEGDVDLQRHKEMLKDIRRGNWTLQQLRDWFTEREAQLTETYVKSTLRHSPDETAIKELLLNCLEDHYGSLQQCVVREDEALDALRAVKEVIDSHARLFQ